ncbi:Hypothetical protein A7982_04808 [Minicystis rosea]|nr:Hypothetical protein A7982_04808 [Minicystis rosea]
MATGTVTKIHQNGVVEVTAGQRTFKFFKVTENAQVWSALKEGMTVAWLEDYGGNATLGTLELQSILPITHTSVFQGPAATPNQVARVAPNSAAMHAFLSAVHGTGPAPAPFAPGPKSPVADFKAHPAGAAAAKPVMPNMAMRAPSMPAGAAAGAGAAASAARAGGAAAPMRNINPSLYRLMVRRGPQKGLSPIPKIRVSPWRHMNLDGSHDWVNSGFVSMFEVESNTDAKMLLKALQGASGDWVLLICVPKSIKETFLTDKSAQDGDFAGTGILDTSAVTKNGVVSAETGQVVGTNAYMNVFMHETLFFGQWTGCYSLAVSWDAFLPRIQMVDRDSNIKNVLLMGNPG